MGAKRRNVSVTLARDNAFGSGYHHEVNRVQTKGTGRVVGIWLAWLLVLGATVVAAVVRGAPEGPFWIAAVPYSIAGAILVTKVPANRFGWVMFVSALGWAALSILRDGDIPFETGGAPFAFFYVSIAHPTAGADE